MSSSAPRLDAIPARAMSTWRRTPASDGVVRGAGVFVVRARIVLRAARGYAAFRLVDADGRLFVVVVLVVLVVLVDVVAFARVGAAEADFRDVVVL